MLNHDLFLLMMSRGAGTDADVFVILHGSKGSSSRVMLPSTPADFERGEKNVFVITVPDVGDIEQITVSHNNKVSIGEIHVDQCNHVV